MYVCVLPGIEEVDTKSWFLADIIRMATSDEEITRLYRIQRTIMQMLNDRGYIVADHELNMSKELFIDKYGEYLKRDALSIQKTRRNDSSDQVGLEIACL